MDFIGLLEQEIGTTVEKNLLPIQPGDVPDTFADVEALVRDVGYKPTTTIEQGVKQFVQWYRDYYQV
jgi:UDP-glucuronate 4-epimerase